MKIILFSTPDIDIAASELRMIFDSLNRNGLDYAVNCGFAEKINSCTDIRIPSEKHYSSITPDMADDAVMVSYGGDGTFLDAVRLLEDTSIPILGINFGHLGFLANVPREDIGHAFDELTKGNYTVQKRSLLHIEGDFETRPEHPYALNEFAIQRRGLSMISVEVFVGGEKLATYRSDGIMISTPTGSTAYSLSVGGPIVAPDCECFVISPIAPHNLTMRPIVVPDNKEVLCKISAREEYSIVSLDNIAFKVRNGAKFRINKGKKSVYLVNLQNISFYDTLRNKMMWGLDSRDKRE